MSIDAFLINDNSRNDRNTYKSKWKNNNLIVK